MTFDVKHFFTAALLVTTALAAPVARAEERLPAVVTPAAPQVDGPTAPPAAQQPSPNTAEAGPVEAIADPVSVAIAGLVADDQINRSFGEKKRIAAVTEFYAERDNAPAWIENGLPTVRGMAVVDRMLRAREDGLDAGAFAVSMPRTAAADPVEAARLDIEITAALAAFAAQASAGRVDPATINRKDITARPEPVELIGSLQAVAASDDPAAVMEGFNPPHEDFRRLKARLAEVRSAVAAPRPEPIPAGTTLKPGMTDDRVPMIRARLELAAPTDPLAAAVYDETTVSALKTFQSKAGLIADGIVGPRTLAMLNGEDRDEEGEILASMEMWRWMPRDKGPDHVFVNIPEYMVYVVRDGVRVHETRVVVGKPGNPTPMFSDEMEYLVVNPYWHVPESIKTKEMLPEIQADPVGFFRRNGYEATWNGRVIDPGAVVWDENAVKAVGIRQVPGERNALGNIKFMFPNKHAVYLHDTPSRKLFQRDYRAYSHGCVRVDDPMSFAGAVLQGDPTMTVDKLKAMFGREERRVDLSKRLKVHIGYFTAWVDDAGTLQIRDDIYGYSKKVKAALGLPAAG